MVIQESLEGRVSSRRHFLSMSGLAGCGLGLAGISFASAIAAEAPVTDIPEGMKKLGFELQASENEYLLYVPSRQLRQYYSGNRDIPEIIRRSGLFQTDAESHFTRIHYDAEKMIASVATSDGATLQFTFDMTTGKVEYENRFKEQVTRSTLEYEPDKRIRSLFDELEQMSKTRFKMNYTPDGRLTVMQPNGRAIHTESIPSHEKVTIETILDDRYLRISPKRDDVVSPSPVANQATPVLVRVNDYLRAEETASGKNIMVYMSGKAGMNWSLFSGGISVQEIIENRVLRK
jgi:hypothetical protein